MPDQAAKVARRVISGLVAFGLLLLLGAPLRVAPVPPCHQHGAAHAVALLLPVSHCCGTGCGHAAQAADACCLSCALTGLPTDPVAQPVFAPLASASALLWAVSREGNGIRHQPALDPPILRA